MMDFNIDYVLGHLPKKGVRTTRTIEAHINNLVQHIDRIIKKSNRISVSKAFVRLQARTKPKVNQFSIVEKLFNHKLRSSFYDLLQGCFNAKSIKKDRQFLGYPLGVLQRVLANKQIAGKQYVLKLLQANKSKSQQRQERLLRMMGVVKEYIRRNFTSTLYRNLYSLARKSIQYSIHLRSFEYLFQTIRVKKLFEAFTCISIKTISKNLAQLEKEKGQKRDQARVSLIKRSQVINQLKRKVANAVGQVNEAQINNNRRRVNGSRENGTKLIKLNEEMRIIEIQTEDLEYKVNSMNNQITRKEYYLNSRQDNEVPFQIINELYHFIATLPQQVPSDLILNKLSSGTTHISSFKQGLNFAVMENVKLKQLINLYEKIGDKNKTESYINSNNQNQTLKMLINSLLKLQLLKEHSPDMLQVANEVQRMAIEFCQERVQIRQGI